MKQFVLSLMMLFTLSLTSCVTTATVAEAQEISYYDDYVYLGVTYPVLYINAIPYYFYGERWVVVPNHHYHYIRHYHRPMYFRGTPPHGWTRPHSYHPVRPRTDYHRPNGNRPDIRHNNPNRGNQSIHRPQMSRPTHVSPRNNMGGQHRSHTPSTRGNSNVNRGGRR